MTATDTYLDELLGVFDQDDAPSRPKPVEAAWVVILSFVLFAGFLVAVAATGNNAGAEILAHRCATTHRIVSGDTLTRIGQKYDVTVDELVAWNNIADPDLIYIDDLMCVTEPVGHEARGPAMLTVEPDWQTMHIPATSNGDSQPPQDVRRAVWMAFGELGVDVFVDMLRIARCESGFDPAAHRTTSNPARLLGDRGLLQMNHVHDGWLASRGVIERASDLFDPYTNAWAARQLYDRADGTGDWFMSQHCWDT